MACRVGVGDGRHRRPDVHIGKQGPALRPGKRLQGEAKAVSQGASGFGQRGVGGGHIVHKHDDSGSTRGVGASEGADELPADTKQRNALQGTDAGTHGGSQVGQAGHAGQGRLCGAVPS